MVSCKFRPSYVFFLLLPAVAACRSLPTFIPSQHTRARRSRGTILKSTSPSRVPLTQLRAGSILPAAVTTITTAKVTSALLGINGVLLLVNPQNALVQKLNRIESSDSDDTKQQELTTWMLRAIGSLGLGVSIQVYASIVPQGVEAITSQQAMGLGLIPRALFFLVTILSGQMRQFKINARFFTINTILTMWCTVSLLFGLGNPAKTAKVYSAMCLLKSIFFVVATSKASEKLLDLPCEGKSLALVRAAGNELMVSALLLVASAWGASVWSSATAAGYACLLWVVLLADMAWAKESWRLMGSNGPRTQLIHMAIAGLLAAGFLLPR